ncbi:MAG: ABC transporter ATP-binding protein [Alphaproteobacteria bacterium]
MTAPLLEVRDLRKWYPLRGGIIPHARGSVRAVDGVSFDVRPGEVLGLAGESGSGKTTIGRCVLRLIEATSGTVRFQGKDIAALGARDLRLFRRAAQIVFQDPFSSLDPRMTVEQIVVEPLRVQGLLTDAKARRARATELLEMVALSAQHLARQPHEMSGGQRQRVGIARALSVSPSFVVADEPVASLDVSIQAQIVNLLSDLRARLGLSMLFISHDIAVMEHLSDRIAVVYLGRIMEVAPKRVLIGKPKHPYTEALLSVVPDPNPAARRERIILEGDIPNPAAPPSGCVFRTRCRYALPECAQTAPPLREVGPDHQTACIRTDIL